MDPQVFEDWMMYILVSGLILFMAFIVWDLAKKSKAGRFGSMILFLALGLGVLGFIIKTVVIAGLEGI
jgi:ABC-type lipoprotein release transport system permease subunit